MSGLPSLRALRYFYHAARQQSFSQGARSLNVSHSAVSHQIRQLEAWLNKPLFLRAAGRVSLTSEGERLLACCIRSFQEIETTCEKIRSRHQAVLSIASSASFLAQWLIPRLGRFSCRYPYIGLTFQTHADVERLRNQQTDVLIISQPHFPAGDVVATRLLTDRIGPVCAAQIQYGLSLHGDFTRLPLLHAESKRQAWAEWAQKTGVRGDLGAGRHFDNLTLAIQAARSGLGIVMAPQHLVQQEIDAGILAAPLGFTEVDRATWMLVKASRQYQPEVVTFRAFLQQEMG